MANLSTENLFLLEFLVDELKMEGKCNCTSPGEICVSFQFLDNEALDVCEGDFNSDKKFAESGHSKTGKSCLFSLTPNQTQKVLQSFEITVCVFKKMQPGWEPEKTCIGSAKISVLPLFMDLITTKEAASAAKVLQDTYELADTKGMQVGKIGVYIRMSCYGKMIITQFQMNMDDKSVLFKDKDGHSLYRYKKSKKGRATKIEDLSSKETPASCPPCCAGQPFEQPNQQQMMFNQPQYPQANQNNYQAQQFNPQMFPPSNMNPMQASFPPPNMNCPTQPCFQDFAQMQDFGNVGPVGSRGFGQQQVSFGGGRQAKSACTGRCSRN